MAPEQPIHFVAHTPQEAAKWEEIARTDPERVLETLEMGPVAKRTNRWGDSPLDVSPCFAATATLAKEGSAPWHRLQDAGVAELLCDGVIHAKLYLPTLPNMSEETQKAAARQIKSGHFVALDVICHAVCSMSKKPNSSERKFLDTLKQRWPQLMRHLWENPQNSLRPESTHASERAVVAKIVARVTYIDISFMSVIDADNDITLTLLTRYFVHCTEEQDTTYLINILTLLTTPQGDAVLIKYRKAHPLPRTWLDRMIRGASSLRKLFDKCGTHLTQTMKSELSSGLVQDFIVLLFELVGGHGKMYASEVRQSASYWTNLFIYMRRNAERKPTPNDTAAERRSRASIRNAIGFTANWMHACHFDAPAQLRPFVELCIKADFFGALDPALPRVAHMQGVNMQLTRIFFCVETVAKVSPGLLKNQFPRPRAAHALLMAAFVDPKTRKPRGPTEFDLTGTLRRDARGMPADGRIFDSAGWQMWRVLEDTAKPRGVCMRRVCDREATKKCAKCWNVEYCGEECEKRDWKDHKIICGVVHAGGAGSGGIHSVTIPVQTM